MRATSVLFAVLSSTNAHINVAGTAVISNANPRVDIRGEIIDAHSGNVVWWPSKKQYFWYGEWYGGSSTSHFTTTDVSLPRLSVYTSPDLEHWTFGGLLHNNSATTSWAASGLWPGAATNTGQWWCPVATIDPKRDKMVIWFTAVPGQCCDAYWGVAESDDGVHFSLITLNETGVQGAGRTARSDSSTIATDEGSSFRGQRVHRRERGGISRSKDGNAVLLDDDGTAYIAYSLMNPGAGLGDHRVAIEKLTPDLRGTANVQVGELFPDSFVEGVMLFKRDRLYYVIYSSCCCACREGAGAVVWSSRSIVGPWARQVRDINCNATAPPPPLPRALSTPTTLARRDAPPSVSGLVCAGMAAPPGLDRPMGHITIPSQGFSVSILPPASPGGDPTYLWSGQRWLSGLDNPTGCTTLCGAATGACAQPAAYTPGHDFQYWIPLTFDTNGTIEQFAPFVDEFNLGVPTLT